VGQKATTLRSLPGTLLPEPDKPFLASADGFSLHAGVLAGADDRKKVERANRTFKAHVAGSVAVV
jgi:hypothetical protein